MDKLNKYDSNITLGSTQSELKRFYLQVAENRENIAGADVNAVDEDIDKDFEVEEVDKKILTGHCTSASDGKACKKSNLLFIVLHRILY